MNERAQSLSWVISAVLLGLIVLSLLLLILTGVLPVKAALQPLGPEAITNQQKAAILGGQNLLLFMQVSHTIYLPALIQ